jgi:hypothetical protein
MRQTLVNVYDVRRFRNSEQQIIDTLRERVLHRVDDLRVDWGEVLKFRGAYSGAVACRMAHFQPARQGRRCKIRVMKKQYYEHETQQCSPQWRDKRLL